MYYKTFGNSVDLEVNHCTGLPHIFFYLVLLLASCEIWGKFIDSF